MLHGEHKPLYIQSEECIDAEDATTPSRERHDKFAEWIFNRTTKRRKRMRKRHPVELQKLNAKITEAEIRRALRGFSNNKAQGPDELHISFLKRTGQIGRDILRRTCNLMFYDWQMVPRMWKERIIKAGKKGDEMKHLRPVSLTSYVGKVLEKIMVFRLSTYVIRLQLLSPIHFAYLRGRSTTDCIVYLTDQIQRNMQRRVATHAVFFDLSSAFDTVQHSVLLWKLEHQFQIRGRFLATLRHFLTDRRSFVRVNGKDSTWQADIIGMPQGGALSPLIYLIYVDGLAAINNIRGIRAAIFSDDISIVTTTRNKAIAEKALQEAVYFVEWYCGHHGLVLNHDKTKYVIFHKMTITENHKLEIFMNTRNTDTNLIELTALKYWDEDKEDKPVKYLGIWMDRRLNFRYHARAVAKQVRGAWYPCKRNLKRVYKIQADIPWTIFNACALTIFEYSAVIWPMMTKHDQNEWKTLYNDILRSALGSCKGESIDQLSMQFGTYPLDQRMQIVISQYFTRFIRTPSSSALYDLLQRKWWNRIRHRLDSPHYKRRRREREEEWRNEEWRPQDSLSKETEFRDTILWHITRIAEEQDNDDYREIHPSTELTDIPRNMGHFNDLTKDWQQVPLQEAEFDDDWYAYWFDEQQRRAELLLFTDGSVKGRVGGYGYHAINGHDYNQINQECNDLIAYRERTLGKAWEYHTDLATRCSIDFCESYAITDALREVLRRLDCGARELDGVRSFRVVSDSETVLRWISGDYTTRQEDCKRNVDEIRRLRALIQRHGKQVYFQWTHSHSELTKGNDAADENARLGYEAVDENAKDRYDPWRYYHQRAALNRCRDPIRDRLKLQFTINVLTSTYATAWRDYLNLGRFGQQQPAGHARRLENDSDFEHSLVADCLHLRDRRQRQHMTSTQWRRAKEEILENHWARVRWDPKRRDKIPGVNWNAYYKRELKLLTRDEARIILGIRSGHNHLNHYMHARLHTSNCPSGLCYCGSGPQTMQHILRSCSDEDTEAQVARAQLKALETYDKAWHDWINDPDRDLPHWTARDIDITAVRAMAFPIRGIKDSFRQKLLRTLTHLFRWVIKHRKQLRAEQSDRGSPPQLQHIPFERG